MKGLFAVAPNKLEILECPRPEAGPYACLVQTEACAFCNSTDTKFIEGEYMPGRWPILLGHETVGRVVQVGEGVTSFKVGDRVLHGSMGDKSVALPGDGRACHAGFAEYNLVWDVWAQKGVAYNTWPFVQQIVPQNIDPVHAAVLPLLKENLEVMMRLGAAGRKVAIVGTGPVAQAMAFFGKLLGAEHVAVFGRHNRWTQRFKALGVDSFVVGDDLPPVVAAILRDGGFAWAVEAVGSRDALSHCLQLAGTRGKVAAYGVPPVSEPYTKSELEDPRVTVIASEEAKVHEQLLDMIARGQVDLASWVSHVLPLREYQQAYDILRSKQAIKVVLTFA
jgi:threonine dehydrogenase-like Zn-dependent dehydrogenase